MTLLLLLGLAAVLAVAVPRWLARAQWAYRCPSLGLLAWQVVPLTVMLTLAGAAFTAVMPWHHARDAMCAVWRMCLDALDGTHGRSTQVVAWVAVLAWVAGSSRLAAAAVALLRARRRRRGHAALACLVGRRHRGLDATVVDHPAPAVYLVPGGSGQVVVTTGALTRLGPDELAAVLAHERAHARGHHHRPVALTALLRRAFPSVGLFDQAHHQVSRLVELCADDEACQEHSPLALASALAALAGASAPAGALAASGGIAVERVHRMMSPPPPLPRRVRVMVAVGLVALPLAPLAIVLAVPAIPVLHAGLPLG
jgi:Zn-dependent protease with chaperone function